MSEKTYTKLSLLVGSTFKVESVGEFVYKYWDKQSSKMVTSLTYQNGYRKVYPITTDKGLMDMGVGQLGSLLEAVFYDGKADLIGKTFSVKSNGKAGLDIRYYFSAVKPEEVTVEEGPEDIPEVW